MGIWRYCLALTSYTTKGISLTKTSPSILFRETVTVTVSHTTYEYIVSAKILSFLRLKYVAHLITFVP